MSLTSLTGYNQWQCNKLPIGCEQAFGLSYFWVPFGKTRTCTCVLVWVLVYYVLKPFPLVIVALCFPHGDFKDEFVHGYCSPAGVAVFCGRHLSARFPWSLSVCPLIIFDSVFQPLCLRLSQYLALPVCLYPSPLRPGDSYWVLYCVYNTCKYWVYPIFTMGIVIFTIQ